MRFNCHRCSYQLNQVSHIVPSAFAILLLVITPCIVAQSSPPAESIENAQALVAANQLPQANEMLYSLVTHDPQNLSAWQELGEVQLAQSLNDDAMKSFET